MEQGREAHSLPNVHFNIRTPIMYNTRTPVYLRCILKDHGTQSCRFCRWFTFFIKNPATSLPNLLKAIEVNGNLSNYKKSISKSEAFNINVPPRTLCALQQNINTWWATNYITYLGVKIPLLGQYLYSPSSLQSKKTWKDGLRTPFLGLGD